MSRLPPTAPVAVSPRYRGLRAAGKRALDLVLGGVLMLLTAPLMAVVALAILVADGRPVLFKQVRVGRDGKPFRMVKFRTMVPDAHDRLGEVAHRNERHGPLFKSGDDPRVTRLGKVLRHTSLDELPQLANVVAGTMSLVGPRPALYEEREAFPPELLAREELPPGLTGLWQVDGRLDADFGKYTELDLRYVRDWSLGMDLRILARTPWIVVRHAWSELRRVAEHADHRHERPALAPATIEATVVPMPAEPAAEAIREATGAA